MKIVKAQVTIYIIIALLIVGTIILIFTVGTNTDNDFDNTNECHSDNDCLRVDTGCCSCSMGGEEVCVVRDKADQFIVDEKECPDDLSCIAMYNCREESCGCVSGKCAWRRY